MNYFLVKEMHDDADTVVFQSNLKVEGKTIPLGIITDNTIYTIIRVQLGAHVLNETNKPILLNYLNKLNRSFKVFKYVIAEDGSIFLDACLPSTNDSFDAEIVRVVLDVIVDHLNNEYKNHNEAGLRIRTSEKRLSERKAAFQHVIFILHQSAPNEKGNHFVQYRFMYGTVFSKTLLQIN